MSTEDVAVSRMGFGLAQPTAGERADRAALQAGIDAVMRAVVADRYNPVMREAMPTVVVGGAVPAVVPGERNGWREAKPLAQPETTGDRVVSAMIDAMQPHGPASPLRNGPSKT